MRKRKVKTNTKEHVMGNLSQEKTGKMGEVERD